MANHKLGHRIGINLTDAEYNAILSRANRQHVSISAFGRQQILSNLDNSNEHSKE